MGKIALLLGALFGQDVTLEGVLALDFASSCQLETLLGAGFGFHLRHGLGFLSGGLLFLWVEHDGHALSLEFGHLFQHA